MPDLSAEEVIRAMMRIYDKDSAGFDFIRALEQRTGMSFTHDTSDPENLCYANSQAVRPEYKINFTPADLWNYISNQQNHQKADINAYLKSIRPKTKQQFWRISSQNQP